MPPRCSSRPRRRRRAAGTRRASASPGCARCVRRRAPCVPRLSSTRHGLAAPDRRTCDRGELHAGQRHVGAVDRGAGGHRHEVDRRHLLALPAPLARALDAHARRRGHRDRARGRDEFAERLRAAGRPVHDLVLPVRTLRQRRRPIRWPPLLPGARASLRRPRGTCAGSRGCWWSRQCSASRTSGRRRPARRGTWPSRLPFRRR